MSKKQPKPLTRNSYTAQHRENARKMYLRGLYLAEISTLLSIPLRTLEKWQAYEKWTILKDCPEIKKRAYELRESGRTAKEVASILKINISTVWRYTKAYKNDTDKN